MAAASGDPQDPQLAAAIERVTADMSAEERAVVARFLERATAIIQRRAVELERTASSERSTSAGRARRNAS